jgi:hypothetical protein
MQNDTGKHYRFEHTVKLSSKNIEEGKVTIKLDPYRITQIYDMGDFALQTILKKTLCAGNRGYKDLRKDLEDIITAAQRKLEMLEEDGE